MVKVPSFWNELFKGKVQAAPTATTLARWRSESSTVRRKALTFSASTRCSAVV
jgi:hypothetical protein